MLERVLAAAHVERVAVREEGLAAQLLDHVGHDPGVVGAQETQVAELAEVDLDGNELVLEVNLVDSGTEDEPPELVELALLGVRAQVGVVDLGGVHDEAPLLVVPRAEIVRQSRVRGRRRP